MMKLTTSTMFKQLVSTRKDVIVLEGDVLKRYQQVVLEIAEDVISVCEKNRIVFHLGGGSALGAVRHKGFIPWDDDIDIDILASDYPRFLHLFEQEYGWKYWIHTCHTPGYGNVADKIRMKGTVARGREDFGTDECGISVDLFQIQSIPDNALLRKLHGILCMGMGYLLSCRVFYDRRREYMMIAGSSREAGKLFRMKIRLGSLLRFGSVKWWAERTQAVYGMCKDPSTRYVSVPSGRNHYFGETYERSRFVATVPAEFEGHFWPVPCRFDEYLRHMYGDYMKLPAEADREKHLLFELKFAEEKTE